MRKSGGQNSLQFESPKWSEGAEREGFEPSVQKKLYNGLAIRRFSPLSHLSPFQIERFSWYDRGKK